ncbi:protein D1 isoform X2 [Bemisia tabaci]|uniref:protein D1 isoform X2 n=1 Tax=Bemisia tabaci TaxID=7038 RepID=UPI003B27DA31
MQEMSKPTLRIKFISKQVILLTLFWASITVSKNWAVKAESDEPTDKPPNTGEGENEFESTRKYEGMGYKDRIPRTAAKIRKELIRNEIIPEFFHTPPRYEAFVTYYNATEPDMGNNLRPEQVRFVPDAVTYRYKPESYYCIVMTGLDEPSKAAPTKREFLHWIVGNIIADNLITGEEIAEYYPVLPKKDSGLHRYLFLVFEQKGKVDFKEFLLTNRNDWGRANWSSRKFSEEYSLGEPYAVNFFYSEYTDQTFTPTTEEDITTEMFYAPSVHF